MDNPPTEPTVSIARFALRANIIAPWMQTPDYVGDVSNPK
jgi:hypothetical protein